MDSVFVGEHSRQKTPTQAVTHIAICIATFRRPEGLRRLLDALENLNFVKAPEPQVSIVVVDNDPTCSVAARPFGTESGSRWPLRIETEPLRGVSYARNTAVKAAIESGAEWIAFIDDDEIPARSWLDELLWVQKVYSADLVAGPVVPQFEKGTPAWVIKGGFFDRPRLKTGTVLALTRTGNLLVSANCFKSGHHFDPDFGKSGGSDTVFTIQLAREGRKIVWADEAVVRETVPLRRANVRYILSRAYAAGSNWARTEYILRPHIATRAIRIAKGSVQAVYGAVSFLPAALLGRHIAMRLVSRAWLGAGEIVGAVGRKARKYGYHN